jgi:hypothetical protein
MLFAGLSLVAIGVLGHLYFGVKYRRYFAVDKHSLHRSSWSMIKDLKVEHPVAANIYLSVYFISLIGVVLIAADHISLR